MKVVGDATISLPYSLHFCAKGPDVEPISIDADGIEITLYFPPSMSEGTVGQSFFPSGWAWWTGTSLRITAAVPIVEGEIDVEILRQNLLSAANLTVRRFLNSYRIRFSAPEIYHVTIDSKVFNLRVVYDNGMEEALPEPVAAFFYNQIPDEAPLTASVNSTTLELLTADLTSPFELPIEDQLLLDADWFEMLGEKKKADHLRFLIDV